MSLNEFDNNLEGKKHLIIKNTINTLLYTYFNDKNIKNNYMGFDDKTNRFILSKLYSLYKKFLNLCNGKIDIDRVKDLENRIYNVKGVVLNEQSRIEYEFLKTQKCDLETCNFKEDIILLIDKLEGFIDNLENINDFMELKKCIVLLQILTSNNITFFEAANELFIEYCVDLNLIVNNEFLVDEQNEVKRIINNR